MTETVVHKYQLNTGTQPFHYYVDLPAHAILLDIGAQGIDTFVWAEHPTTPTTSPDVRHHFVIVGTGQTFDSPGYPFYKRIVMVDGRLIFHAYKSPQVTVVQP